MKQNCAKHVYFRSLIHEPWSSVNSLIKPTIHSGETAAIRVSRDPRKHIYEKKVKLGLRQQVEGGKPGAGGAASEGVLANFFNSLLNKKSGTGAAMGRGGTAVRSDAAAELDRMNRAKKIVPQGNAPNDTTETS